MTIDNDISDFTTPRSEEQSFPSELFYESDKTVIEKIRIHGKWHLIKRIAKDYEFSPQHRTSLEREFEIGFQLDHSNIVRYIDKKYDNNGVPYLILEYIDGCTLRDLMLKPQGLNDFNFAKCFKTILETLIYLHKHQIYHLDIKPENIVITYKEHNVKLIDFGFAESDSFGQPLGSSFHYKAPEFNGDVSLISGKTDMYSFALTMKELCETASVSLPRRYKKVISKSLNNDVSNRIDAEKALEVINKKPEVGLWLLLLLPVLMFLTFLIFNNQKQGLEIKQISLRNRETPIPLAKSLKEEKPISNTNVRITGIPSEKVWRKSFDSSISAAGKIEFYHSSKDSTRCVKLGKSLWNLYKQANNKHNLTKRKKIKFRDKSFDSLYTIYLEYEKNWVKGSPEFIFYSGLWYSNIQSSQDSVNGDVFRK